ncbi:hypothetical protein D3C87_1362020 [compost metagenome]
MNSRPMWISRRRHRPRPRNPTGSGTSSMNASISGPGSIRFPPPTGCVSFWRAAWCAKGASIRRWPTSRRTPILALPPWFMRTTNCKWHLPRSAALPPITARRCNGPATHGAAAPARKPGTTPRCWRAATAWRSWAMSKVRILRSTTVTTPMGRAAAPNAGGKTMPGARPRRPPTRRKHAPRPRLPDRTSPPGNVHALPPARHVPTRAFTIARSRPAMRRARRICCPTGHRPLPPCFARAPATSSTMRRPPRRPCISAI